MISISSTILSLVLLQYQIPSDWNSIDIFYSMLLKENQLLCWLIKKSVCWSVWSRVGCRMYTIKYHNTSIPVYVRWVIVYCLLFPSVSTDLEAWQWALDIDHPHEHSYMFIHRLNSRGAVLTQLPYDHHSQTLASNSCQHPFGLFKV